MSDRELRDLHRGAREERARLIPDPGPEPEPEPAREHDCLHHLGEDAANLETRPPHVVTYTCKRCGASVDFDTETGEHTEGGQ